MFWPERMRGIFIGIAVLLSLHCTSTNSKIRQSKNAEEIVFSTETWNSGRMHLADNRTSLFDPGRGRSFLTTLGLAVFKIIKLACLCSFFTILLLLLCPLIPLVIPALFLSLLFTFFLIGLLKFVPQVSMQMPPVPVPPTFPPGPPPFETVPAYV